VTEKVTSTEDASEDQRDKKILALAFRDSEKKHTNCILRFYTVGSMVMSTVQKLINRRRGIEGTSRGKGQRRTSTVPHRLDHKRFVEIVT
jgi:hypothetical protein